MAAEFGYTAETQSEQREKNISEQKEKIADPHDVKIMKKAIANTKLPSDAWKELKQDILNGAGKSTICNKYGVKRSYFKYLRNTILSASR